MRPTVVSAEDDSMYMDVARRISERSHDLTHKVGCVVVHGLGSGQRIISYGWNGMPTGHPNPMEVPELKTIGHGMYLRLRTNPLVRHAEFNALTKAKYDEVRGCVVYTTLSPCADCAALIWGYGAIEVVYDQEYRSDVGIEYLRERGLLIRKMGT